MKTKLIYVFFLLLLVTSRWNVLLSQSTSNNNSPCSPCFLGWDAGTTGGVPLEIRTQNTVRLAINDGNGNVGIGTATPNQLLNVAGNVNINSTFWYGINNTRQLYIRGTNNLMVGISGNTTLTGVGNILVGDNAGAGLTSGSNNTFVGLRAGQATTTVNDNTFVGVDAGRNNIGASNSFYGTNAGFTNSSGQHNTYLGFTAGNDNSTGELNVAIGSGSGYRNTTDRNVIIGVDAGFQPTSSQCNVFVGYHAGFGVSNSSTGDNNTFIGYQAGDAFTTGNSNTYIGYNADGTATLTNATAIGANASVTASDNVILGNNCNVGIGTTAALQKLHVVGNARITAAYYDSNNDPGTNGQVLSTTVTGTDWVNATGTTSICGGSGTTDQVVKFTSSSVICNSIITDDGTRVGISSTSPSGKLNVVNSSETVTGNYTCTNAGMTDIIKAVYNQTSTGNIDGIEVSITNSSGINNGHINGVNVTLSTTSTLAGLDNIGYRSTVTSSSTETTQKNYGVFAVSSGASIENHGIYGDASSANNETGSKNYGGKLFAHKGAAFTPETNYGVWAKGYEASTNYGGYFIGTDGTTNYGVYATAGSTGTNYAAYFSGDGVLTGSGWSSSDINLKQNIQPIDNNLSIINQLQPKKFEFRTNEYPQMNLSSGQHYGLIAQELQLVLPDLVRSTIHPSQYDSLGNETFSSINYFTVNYTELIPFLIGAIKEQQLQIEDLNTRLNSCCGPGIVEFQIPDNGSNQPSTINHQELASVARDLPVLSQNQPNPFSEKTLIRFYIPKTTKEAAIKVFDNTGSVHRLFSITGEGPGTIELEANSLAAGNYYYSLLVGGNVIDTKTMVITK
jgi:hypothetical protein